MWLCAVPGRVWPIAFARRGECAARLDLARGGPVLGNRVRPSPEGFAGEAGQALLDYGFGHLRLRRVVAMTRYDNAASIGVMRKLGMRIEHNGLQDPPWLQVVGILEKR